MAHIPVLLPPIEPLETRRLLTVFGEDLSYDPDRPPTSIPQGQLLVRLPDGDFLAAGNVNIPDDSLDADFQKTILSRVNPDFSLDTSFGTNGQVDIGTDVVIVCDAPRRRLLYVTETGQQNVVLVAYTTDGVLDNTFGGDGQIAVPYAKAANLSRTALSGQSIAHVYDNGTVLVQVEIFYVDAPRQYQLVQMRPDGTHNTAFANNGIFLFNQRQGFADAFVTSRGIYVHVEYGFGIDPPGADLQRFSSDGRRKDTSFGGGDAKIRLGPFAFGFTEQPDGKLLFVSPGVNRDDPELHRINVNGAPDTTFSGDGKITLSNPNDPGGGPGTPFLDSQNRIVIQAETSLFRFSPTGQLDSDPIYNGSVVFTGSGPLSYEDGNDAVILAGGEFGRRFTFVPEVQVADGPLDLRYAFVTLDHDDDTITITQLSSTLVRFVVNGQTFNVARNDFDEVWVRPFNGDANVSAAVDIPIDFSGGNGDDTIVTGSAADNIGTGAGDSRINSGNGDDTINAGSFSADLTHVIDGGTGNKDITVSDGSATITLGRGNHRVLTGAASANSVITINGGGSSNVSLIGDGDQLFLNGRGNNFVLVANNATHPRVTTGSGDDEIIVQSTTAIVHTHGGNDRFTMRVGEGEATGPTIFAGSGDDRVEADPVFDGLAEIHGGDGNDHFVLGGGRQSLYGEGGKDTLVGGDGADLLSGGGGNDSLQGGASRDRLYGGDGNDVLVGESGNDLLQGHDGRDTLFGGSGDDTLLGGAGADRLYSQRGSDELFGEGGDDFLFADYDEGTQTLHGGAGNDRFVTIDGLEDQIFGDGGEDAAKADGDDALLSVESA